MKSITVKVTLCLILATASCMTKTIATQALSSFEQKEPLNQKLSTSQIDQAFKKAAIIINKQLQNYNYLPDHTVSSIENFYLYEERLHTQWAQFLKNPESITSLQQVILNPYTQTSLEQLLAEWESKSKYSICAPFMHTLAAVGVAAAAKYSLYQMFDRTPIIHPLKNVPHTEPLKLDDSSIKTLLINHWVTPLVNQYNQVRANTIDGINENINSANQTINSTNNLINNLKTAGIISVAIATTAALYGLYKHHQHVTFNKPIREILFKMYELLTNQPESKTTPWKVRAFALELETLVPQKMQNLQYDLQLLADYQGSAAAKTKILERILMQYQF